MTKTELARKWLYRRLLRIHRRVGVTPALRDAYAEYLKAYAAASPSPDDRRR